MTSTRIGFAEDFSLKNQLVGIGTNQQEVKLRVVGTIKGDFNVKDETTLSVYSGFIVQNYNINVPSVLSYTSDNVGTFTRVNERETDYLKLEGEYNTLSEDIIVDEDRIFEVSDDSLVSVGTLESVSIQSHFSVPDGGTNERPDQPVEGMVRFNDDLNTLEFYNGIEWRQFTVSGASGRGVFGSNGTYGYVNIHTLGNAEYFGDAVSAGAEIRAAFGSSTRGIWGGGYSVTGIEYVTLASAGNAIEFGNLTGNYFRNTGGCSSSTRGLFYGGGLPAYYNVIEYVEINTLGNSLDFGDQTNSSAVKTCFSSPTRGFSIGGYNGTFGAGLISTIDVVTISSKGDAIEFGDVTERRIGMFGLSNSVRGVFGGGYNTPNFNSINSEYVTMSSNGNGIDFGDLTQGRTYPGGTASQTRGIIFGGVNPTNVNTIDYINISSTGNAQDFGDHIESQTRMRGTSDSHGGLGGF